jgi:DNA polymerase gamma 1
MKGAFHTRVLATLKKTSYIIPHTSASSAPRCNAANIQMLSESLHDQIFHQQAEHVDDDTAQQISDHLQSFGLADKPTSVMPEVDFTLPPLLGENIDKHFQMLALKQTQTYRQLAQQILRLAKAPPRPRKWIIRAGWTKYDPVKKVQCSVPYPDSDVLVFDIEQLVPEGNYPTLATAVSPDAWYV